MIEYCPEMQEIHRLWKILKHPAYFGPKTPLIYLFTYNHRSKRVACLFLLLLFNDGWMNVRIELQTEENGEHLSLEFNEI